MAPLEVTARLIAGILLILANAFFVATEFGLTRARQYTEEEFVDGDPALQRAWDMTDDLEVYLTTCQVWISGTSIALGIVAEPGLAALIEPVFENTALASVGAASLVAFGLINLVHLTHGEQTPTYLGVERSRQVCRYGARPLYWFARSIGPLITFGDWVAKATLRLFGIEMTGAWTEAEADVIESRADLRRQLDDILEQGDMPEERREEIQAALDIDRLTVGDEMVPRDDIVTLSTTKDVRENLQVLEENPHTRFPLVGDSLEDFEGIVYIPVVTRHFDDLRDGDRTFADLAVPPLTFTPETSIAEAIDRFQDENQELALVVEDDEVVGLLTATDAMEAVTGELADPTDPVEERQTD
nr:hemolysin family protein [Halomarina sp. PSRA2]